MKDKFITVLLTIIVILIISCIVILGINIYNDYIKSDTASSVEEWFGDTVESYKQKINLEQEVETPQILNNSLNNIQSEQNEQNIQYNTSNIKNKYFYNQLEKSSKIIYSALYENKENLKTGTYAIQFGNAFSEILSSDDGQEILGSYYQSAIESFLYDNPDVFYLNPNKMFLNVESTTSRKGKTFNVFISNGEQVNYLADGFSSKEQIEQCEKLIESVAKQILEKSTGNQYDKVKKIHDLLVANLEYDSSVSKDNIYNIYGALVNRECVCEGYAKSYKYLLDKAGVNSIIVVGKATNSQGQTENHSWNYVQLDGNWYAIDVTWDDPVVIGNGNVSNDARYKYFLKGYNSINKDHTVTRQFTEGGKEFNYPSLSTNDY